VPAGKSGTVTDTAGTDRYARVALGSRHRRQMVRVWAPEAISRYFQRKCFSAGMHPIELDGMRSDLQRGWSTPVGVGHGWLASHGSATA
jgi:hypothetical protein